MLSVSPPVKSDSGDYPSVAIHPTKKLAVCAYESSINKGLFYRIGNIKHNTIQWKKEIGHGTGEYVRVAIFDKNDKTYIISVYISTLLKNCYYQISELEDDGKIKFRKPIKICRGLRPTLAAREDGTFVLVIEQRLKYTLECHVGKINDDMTKIEWQLSPDVIEFATTPSVAINNTHIILFYRIRASNSLKYFIGTLTDKIEWAWASDGQNYSTGIRPNVTLNNDRVALITHMSFMGRKLYFGVGIVTDQGLTVTSVNRHLGFGMHPAICLSDDNTFIEVHRTNFGSHLYVSQGIWSPAAKDQDQPVNDPADTNEYIYLNQINLSFGVITPIDQEESSILPDGHYEMNKWPPMSHGIAVIINNKTFTNKQRLPTRDGSETDVTNLNKVFHHLGYEVHIYNDCTARQMENIMDEMQTYDHSNYDSFVCCIMSHGGKNQDNKEIIYSSDDQQIVTDTLFNKLQPQRCPTLASKPKIFFIQACRGDCEEQSVAGPPPTNSVSDSTQTNLPPRCASTDSTNEAADFYKAYATPSGYVAWRNNNGSYYVIELCRALASHSRQSSLRDIVLKANHQLSSNSSHQGDVTQTIEVTHTLKKKVFFF